MAERPLHIGVDARELLGHPTGVGRFLLGLLGAWSDAATMSHTFTLFVPGAPPPSVASLGDRFVVAVEPAPHAGTWWEQVRLPRAAVRAGIDVLFSPGYTAPLRLSCPSVVAIHDVSFFAHPEWFAWREGLRRRWLTRAGARRASLVVTLTEFSAREIERWLGVPRERIRLAPPGAPTVAPRADASPREPVVLFVGSLFNRRRIPDLLRGFAQVAARVPDARLVLVGDNRTHPPIDPLALAADLGLGGRVEWRAYVSDEALEDLYWAARVFVFLSEYEGFAMTPLEALAHNVPPVLLDTPVAREVYGDAAWLVSMDTLVAGLVDLLTDENARSRVLAEGRRRLATYTWARAAATVRAALEHAADVP